MSSFRFATLDKNMAQRFLSHEKYSHLTPEQKEFILNNLSTTRYTETGKLIDNEDGFRVCDPDFHGAMITTKKTELMVEFDKLSKQDVKTRLFNYAYMSGNFEMTKSILDNMWKGEEIPSFYFEKFIVRFNIDEIEYLLERGVISVEDIRNKLAMCANGHLDIEDVVSLVSKIKETKYTYILNEVHLHYMKDVFMGEKLYYAGLGKTPNSFSVEVQRSIKKNETNGIFREDVQDRIVEDLRKCISTGRSYRSFKSLQKLNSIKGAILINKNDGEKMLDDLIHLLKHNVYKAKLIDLMIQKLEDLKGSLVSSTQQ